MKNIVRKFAFFSLVMVGLSGLAAKANSASPQIFVPIAVGDITIFIPTLDLPEGLDVVEYNLGAGTYYDLSWDAISGASYYQINIVDEYSAVTTIDVYGTSFSLADLPLGESQVSLLSCTSSGQCTYAGEIGTYAASELVQFAHADMLGSPILKTDLAGNVISQSHYKPFGETEEEKENDIGYTGHLEDTDLDLTYMQARYYDPVLGRFYSNDPVDYLGHLNRGNPVHGFGRYTYANNNPYKYTDPDGEFAHIAIGAFAGGLISGVAYALTTDNFSAKALAVNVASGAAVGAVTAAVPGAIAAGSLNFGGKVANAAVSGGNAVAAGAAGNVATQAATTGNVDAGKALLAGVANAAGLGAGNALAKPAAAVATVKTAGNPGLPVTSLNGNTFMVGKVNPTSVTSEGVQQGVQDIAGETASAVINETAPCVANGDSC